jgi:hypothetical protein
MNQLNKAELRAVEDVLDSVAEASGKNHGGGVGKDAAKAILASNGLPASLAAALAVLPEEHHADLLDSINAGQSVYQAAHGRAADPSITVTALQRLVADRTPMKDLGIGRAALDSATNVHHNQLSLQPAAAILAVMKMFSEAHPLAVYLPTDVKSNEARLIIAEHATGSDFGDYTANSSLNGILAGGSYFDGERMLNLGSAGGAGYTVTVTARNGVAAGAGNPALPLLRGRTMILVNGRPVAYEARIPGGSGNNSIAGQVVIAGTTHAITGTSNSDTGVVAATFAPALPAGHAVGVIAYVDYERDPDLAPKINFMAQSYSMFAHASRGLTELSIDAQTQFSQEAGLDARGQMQLALRNQLAAERFYKSNYKLLAIAQAFQRQWDYDYTTQIGEKDYFQLWANLQPVLAAESQAMAERTNDHGIDTLFMTGDLAALCRGLPPTMWQSSGLVDRPGVYRMGKLFGLYDTYYVPAGRGLVDNPGAGTSQILAAGRGTEVARNPLVMGDAVPAMLVPLAFNSDMKTKDGFYHRGFSEINPHPESQLGAALINVINLN